MELRFASPELASLDDLDAEVLACTVWSDARPSHGVAGLCDFRLAGRISALERAGHVTGALGEVSMLPGKPLLTFHKLLLFGAGPRARFDEDVFREVVLRMLSTMEGLCVRVLVAELPGRYDGLIPAERAADVLLASAGRRPQHDVWTLVEDADGKQRITQHMIEERRRVRRVG
ncbi:MAG TPA: M17 family peptidase N-terminal domain-containing protein [Minicystis sp.]|nr:M17 family peptidase N-terminal domain-containing protein [Minicystis sp.]